MAGESRPLDSRRVSGFVFVSARGASLGSPKQPVNNDELTPASKISVGRGLWGTARSMLSLEGTAPFLAVRAATGALPVLLGYFGMGSGDLNSARPGVTFGDFLVAQEHLPGYTSICRTDVMESWAIQLRTFATNDCACRY